MKRKERKLIIQTGVDANGSKYFYYCRKCHSINPLHAVYCGHCGKKRPRDAFENAYIETVQPKPIYGMDIDRTARNAYPAAPAPCFAIPMPTNGNYDPENYVANTLAGLPKYYQTDEFGRVYRAKVSYGALPCSYPVPVATPSKHVQTSAINIPITNQ